MIPHNAALKTVLRDMLDSKDVAQQARAENLLWDERIGAKRLDQYEAAIAPWFDPATYRQWCEVHNDYLCGHITVDSPVTFTDVNAAAALPAAVMSELGEEQELVRIESLDYAIHGANIGTTYELENALNIYRQNKAGDNVTVPDAKALLEKLCGSLNANPNALRPRFAAFAQELAEDIDAGDWANRLHDRLGLSHMGFTDKFGSQPVALMRYRVRDIKKRAQMRGAAPLLTVPTVLDAELNQVFHPAPREANYGRTLHLGDNSNCDRLASELLHPRFNYEPGDICKIGMITLPAGVSPERLAELRQTHIFCLRCSVAEREDFGKIPAL